MLKKREKESDMADERTVCVCTDCGNEANMILACNKVEVGTGLGKIDTLEEDEENCRVCRDEANMILNF